MKRDFLKGLGLEDEMIEQIMSEHGKAVNAAKADAEAQKQSLAARETEIEGLKGQLAQRDQDIKTLKDGAKSADEVRAQLATLQGKYDEDTKALNKRLQDQQAEFATQTATSKFFEGVKFSSALARDAAIAKFRSKGFKLDGDTFLGGKEWLDDLRKTNPDAFPAEEPAVEQPRFGGSTKGIQQPSNPFTMSFTPVRSAGLPKK